MNTNDQSKKIDVKKLLLGDFTEAINRLKEALDGNEDDDVYKAGCIQYFEFCFELAWKTIKTFAEDQGLKCYSPKSCLKIAYKLNWIDNEIDWLNMLDARNLMSHVYDQKSALTVYESLAGYVEDLENLKDIFAKTIN